MKRIIFILSVLGVGMAETSAVAGSSVLGESSPNLGTSESMQAKEERLAKLAEKLSTSAQYEESLRAAQAAPVPDTLSDMKTWAEQGNVDYQLEVGRIYYEGEGVRQDLVLSRRMFQKAANKGDIRGQMLLGFFYENGLGGLRQNRATAKELFGKTCDKGFQRGCDEYRRLNKRGY